MRPRYTMAVLLLCAAPLAPPGSWAQTYDTPSTLAVHLSHPTYMYVDESGHAVITGMIQNDSEHSDVGNITLLAKFYDRTGSEPLYTAMSPPLLQVMPPQSSSPFAIRSPQPDARIADASVSILIFTQANPKVGGLLIGGDAAGGSVTVQDTARSPHSNVTLHVAYHDAFEPPRILYTQSHYLGDMGIGGSLHASIHEYVPYNARSFAVYAESDAFSSESVHGRLAGAAQYHSPDARILDAWVENDSGERSSEIGPGQNAALAVSVEVREGSERPFWLYVQVKQSEDGAVAYLEGVMVERSGMVMMPWSPGRGGYLMEAFLWGDSGIPVASPAPLVLFTAG